MEVFSNKEYKIKKELCNIMYYVMNFNIKIIKKNMMRLIYKPQKSEILKYIYLYCVTYFTILYLSIILAA